MSVRMESQPLRALRRGNELRLRRAAVKREIASVPTTHGSRACAARHLEDPEDALLGMAVSELLEACRRNGRLTMLRLLRNQRIGELRKIGELTDRQRLALARELRR